MGVYLAWRLGTEEKPTKQTKDTSMKTRKGLSTFNDNGVINFKLYDTIILKVDSGKYILNSGGWLTNHTKNCINDNLPSGYKVFQQEGTWKVQTPEAVLKFEDNMTIE